MGGAPLKKATFILYQNLDLMAARKKPIGKKLK
jgi:hypothetical protein